MNERFRIYARVASDIVGRANPFLAACVLVLLWAASGPFLHFSDSWQLIVNTGTSILTFLIVFLIQHTQNRDTRAIRLKLDELLSASGGARTSLIDLERLSDDEMARLENEFRKWRERHGRERPHES